MNKIITRVEFYVSYLFKLLKNVNYSYIKYFTKWIHSMKSNSVKDESPWITFESKYFLDTFLDKNKKVFEWGSGGSTIYFSNRVNKIVLVEHNKEWFEKVASVIKDKEINNIEYLLVEPKEKPELNVNGCFSSDVNYSGKDFSEYCDAISSYPDNYFDLIVVDGRVRNCCINKAIKKLSSNGLILLDNSDVKEYASSLKLLKEAGFKSKKYFGPGPYVKYFWETTILKK